VHGNPFADADAEGGEFSFPDPHASEALTALGGDAEASGKADEKFFEKAEVEVQVASTIVEIEDGIAGELAGAVVGGLAAAIGLEDGVRKSLAEARAVACAADGVDGLVLEKDESFVALAGLHLLHEPLLERERGFKGESTGK
jgi:hypothetical protein